MDVATAARPIILRPSEYCVARVVDRLRDWRMIPYPLLDPVKPSVTVGAAAEDSVVERLLRELPCEKLSRAIDCHSEIVQRRRSGWHKVSAKRRASIGRGRREPVPLRIGVVG